MTRDDAKRHAELIADDIVGVAGGPVTTRADAVKLLTVAIFEAYQKGWNDKQRQLSDNMYPR